MLALVLGLLVSAGLYFAYLWPSVEPIDELADGTAMARAIDVPEFPPPKPAPEPEPKPAPEIDPPTVDPPKIEPPGDPQDPPPTDPLVAANESTSTT